MPALSKSLRARARSVSRRTRRSARGKNGRNLSRTFTCTRSCAFYSREFFFLSSCVRFVLRALGFDDILLSRFQNEGRYFSIFPSVFWKCRTKKKAREVMKERGFFFCFLAGKICLLFCPKAHRRESNHVLCKGGGRGVQLAFAAFYYFVQRR